MQVDEVSGWALQRGSCDPVELKLMIDGKVYAVQSATEARPGTKQKGLHPTGRCGFRFQLPKSQWLAGGEVVRVLAETTDLTNSPLTFQPEPRAQVRLFFLHIPKTAGSSLNNFIASHFPSRRVKTHVEASGFRDDPQYSEKYDFISGHIKSVEAQHWLNLEGFHWITLLRNPLEQLASHLSWVRFVGHDTDSQFFKHHPEPVRDLAIKLQSVDYADADQLRRLLYSDDQRVATLFDNFQTRALVYIKGGERVSELALKKALERLDLFTILGTTENYDAFIESLCSLGNWQRPAATKRLNSQPKRYGLDINDPATRAVLNPLVQFDSVLYDNVAARTK